MTLPGTPDYEGQVQLLNKGAILETYWSLVLFFDDGTRVCPTQLR